MRPPNDREREIVADVMVQQGGMVGSVADLWSHPDALRIHGTLRLAVVGIFRLVSQKRAIGPGRLKAEMRSIHGEGHVPFMDEVVHHVLQDGKARAYWDDLMPDASYPHQCPRCGLAGFISFRTVECKTEGCR